MMSRTPKEAFEEYVPDIPKKSTALLVRTILKLRNLKCGASFQYDFDKREMKGRQVLILAQHTSRDDPYFAAAGYPFVEPNAIMSKHNALIPVVWRLLLASGVILKSIYEPDIGAMRDLMRLHKKGASFLLFPEGIESADGTTQPLHPATARLIKKLAMDTVLCTNRGAFLCDPRFDTNKRKGRLEYHYELLFHKEEVEKMTKEELYSRLLEKFRYNDFAWNSEKQYRYKGKVPLAHGLDNMLFICPRCKKQFEMHVEEDRLKCSCGSEVCIDDRYNIVPCDKSDFPFRRIDEWNRWQRGIIEEETKREDFTLADDVTYRTLNMDDLSKGRFIAVGEGRLTLDREKLRYTGTKNGEAVELEFDISRLPGTAVTSITRLGFYYDREYYQFVVKSDGAHAVKMETALEILHDAGDPERSKARKDAMAE